MKCIEFTQWLGVPPAKQESRGVGLIPGSGGCPGEGNDNLPVFLPEKFHGLRSLAGCGPWDHEESDTSERVCVHARARPHTTVSVVKESSYKHRSQFVCKVLFSINSTYSKSKGHKIKKLG